MENLTYLMNVVTGSIDILENWMTDYENRDMEFQSDMSFEEWADGLIEVDLINGQWIEV